ncbi:MAG: ATP-binding cassette domain-containing protein, partial [Rhodospirillales bacterium]|nr:ATP-binding cassette domain-containing protein [Rhodospirillales bacterium]
MLEVAHLQAGYGQSRVLFDVSLAIGPGEVVALLGRNGMGKTTSVATIMGLLPATSGTIRHAGASVAG